MIHCHSLDSDTICALATAPGGALGIIRVSGPQALSMVSKICRRDISDFPANSVRYTHIVSTPLQPVAEPQQQIEIVDEAPIPIQAKMLWKYPVMALLIF